jgi:hypothetical protein
MFVCFVASANQLIAAQSEKDSGSSTSHSNTKKKGRKRERARNPIKRDSPQKTGRKIDIYRVRVTVIDEQQKPVDDAKVWSTSGGEKKKIEGGWQFDIPAAGTQINGKVTFYATKESAFSRGQTELQLAEDPNPAVTIRIARHVKDVMVRGIVIDEAGKSIAGARVNVLGYEAEAVTTQANGGFVLPAHAADGQQVYLHIEAATYKAVNRWHPAGNEPATIVLEKE